VGQLAGIATSEIGTQPFPIDCSSMGTRCDEIDLEIRHLRKLATQLTDQQTLDGIKTLIARLEVEKAELDSK
jgi:hypothetical protein